jgi:hypothetical protein
MTTNTTTAESSRQTRYSFARSRLNEAVRECARMKRTRIETRMCDNR